MFRTLDIISSSVPDGSAYFRLGPAGGKETDERVSETKASDSPDR